MENKNTYPRDYDGSQYGIDLNNPETQPMSECGPTHAVLQETVYGWLNGTTMFFSLTDMASYTYGMFVEHIGCDAQEFCYDPRGEHRVYTWVATDKPTAKFSAFFKKNDNGEWTINATGAAQVRMPEEFIEKFKNS